ncbi:MAG: Rieske 2Fe-2S domain-containing protein [Planctomycetota bacterium JB042]
MLSAEDQDRLTRVGPGTPMGELLRRYWMPVAATGALAREPVVPVRILGEDLALFRDAAGRFGLVEARCPHRGASLAHGWVDGEGLRCPYHGWRFDRGGRCLDAPAAGADAPRSGAGVDVRAYPVRELGGLLFAYLGPAPAPLLPRFDALVEENALRDVGQALLPCNFLQIMENSVDPLHVEWLHGRALRDRRRRAGQDGPEHYGRRHLRIEFERFEFGILKRRVLEGDDESGDDWRIGHPLVFPVMLRVGSFRQLRLQFRVPVDDTHTRHLWYSCYRPPEGEVLEPQGEVPLYEVPWRDERGAFRVDFVDGQDVMTWVTQGAIADRTREHLGAGDRGIVMLRSLYLEQIARVESGLDPLGVRRDPSDDRRIDLPCEREKFGRGAAHLRESLRLGHARFSPLFDRIAQLFD